MKRTLLFLCLSLFVTSAASAYEFSAVSPSGHTLYYNIVDGHAEVVSPGTGSIYNNYVSGDLTIPSTVTHNNTTYSVTALAAISFNGTFEGCSGLTSVTIPNSVTSIGEYAFHNCSGLTSVTIPNSVTSIGDYAFAHCSGLTSVNYTGTIAQWCSINFSGSSSNPANYSHTTLSINGSPLTNLVIPEGVTEIKQYAFYNCSGLTSVTIPNSVTSIGYGAFAYCSGLTSVTIPNSVTSIRSSAFSNVRHIEYYGSASGSPWGAISMNGIMKGDFVFSDSTKHYLVVYAGMGGSVTIPSSVVTIGDKAFYGCSGLTSVTIPNSVTSIGEYAFHNCSGLTSVTIGNSVTSIDNHAFAYCSGLTSVNYTGTIAQWCSINFSTSSSNPASYSHTLSINGSPLTNLVIPEGVTEIKQYAFYNCSGLTSVTIPNSVTSIGYGAFAYCSGLTSVTIPNSVTSIDYDAFNGCSNLTEIWLKPTTPPTLGNASPLGAETVPLVVPHNSYNAYTSAGASYTNHPIYRDSIIVEALVNDTLRGYVTGGDTVLVYPYDNETVTLTATANYGYHFVRWDDNITDNPRHIVTNSGITRTAIFDFNKYTITLQTDTSIHGSCNGGGSYNYLSERTIQANASYGYHFTHWQDGSTNNPRTVLLTQDTSFIAYYDRNTYTLTFQSADTNKGIVNTVSVTGEYLDTTILIDAIAIPHYHFVRWNDNNTENPRRFVIDDNRTYTAYFSIDVHNVSVQIDNIAHGTVDGSGSREYGQPITVSATPFSGYQFTHWSNGSTYNPYTFAVLQDSSLTAFFVADGEPWQDTVVLYDTINVDVHDTTYIPYAVHDTTYIDVPYPVHDTTYINVHDTTYIPYAVHDTTYIDVYDTTYINVHDTTYIPYAVHDTTYIDVHDTTYINVHDTTYIPYAVHDTTYIDVHDTTYINVHDTTYIPYAVHDTTYIDVHDTTYINVHDTTYIPYAVHDTTYIDVHDTTYINVHDTTYIPYAVHDTTYIPYAVHDTTYIDVHDTTYIDVHDTTYIDVHDTTYIDVHDTTYIDVFVFDTTIVTDTVTVTQFDTITNTVYDTIDNFIYDTLLLTDTVWLHDTIVIHDTVYITQEGINGVDALNAKVYSSQGQIVVEGAEGNMVTLYDVNGRVLATKQDDFTPLRFDAPVSGTYMIKIGAYPARKVVVIR